MAKSLVLVPLALILCVLCAASFGRMETLTKTSNSNAASDPEQRAEALYLPRAEAIEGASLGYKNALAHLLWFKTINYFGKQYRGQKNYRWLAAMCDLVSRLTPQAPYVYRFCGTLLSWEGNLPEESVKVLSRAIELYPDDWYFYYLRGFTKIYFLGDESSGAADLKRSAELPGAPPLVLRLAAKTLASQNDLQSAIRFLEANIKITEDSTAKQALSARLQEAFYELGFQLLESASQKFLERLGRAPVSISELKAEGFAPQELAAADFRDPFGGHYEILTSGEIRSSSGKPRDALRWKRHTSQAAPSKEKQ